MHTLVATARATGERSEHPLEVGACTAGGGESDAVRLPALPPGALRLEVDPGGLVVTPLCGEARLGTRPLAAGVRRLVRPAERLEIGDYDLWLEARGRPAAEGTASLARGLLAAALCTSDRPAPIPTLVWLNGRDCGKRLPLVDEATFLGRGEGCAARVRDALASRTHARIVQRAGEVRLFDGGSANGVGVDGEPVVGERRLFGGEVIAIGQTELAFEASLPRTGAAPSPAQGPAGPPQPGPAPDGRARRRARALELSAAAAAIVAAGVGIAAIWLLSH